MKNSKIKTISTILFLGGLWGLLEATLGTILHLDIFDSVMFTSTAILLPIAYLIMGRAYKTTGKARCAFYVGLVAATIKAVCFFFVPAINKVVNPMVAIVLESLVAAVAFRVAQPKNILSVKSFVTFIVMSFAFRVTYVGYSMATAVPFQSAYLIDGTIVWNEIFKYVVITNAISFAYMALFMGVGYGIKLLVSGEKSEKFTAKVQYFAYSPVFAVVMIAAAVATTALL